MKYRKIADRKISALGFGCMRLPVLGDDQGRIDEPEAARMLHYAIDHGVNYVDNAWSYHRGESEAFVGRALKGGYREKVLLATKLPSWAIHTREDCDKYLNEQLKRMRTDRFDFYLLHALDADRWSKLMQVDIIDFMDCALRDGRIGHAGFSFHGLSGDFKPIIDSYNWTLSQIQYNYMDENFQAGTEGLKYASGKGISVVVMEPLRGGKLAKSLPDQAREFLEKRGIVRSPAQLALKWVWNHPEVSCVLSGMSTMEQVVENCRIADDSLPDSLTADELAAIEKIRKLYLERTVVDCTGCRYCMPCPEGVSIPEILSIYNEMHIYRDKEWARQYYQVAVRPDNRADKCVECGTCEEACPQGIKVIEMLKEIREALVG